MTWELIARLIVLYGIEGAYKIWAITKEGEPTVEAWEKLRALSLKAYDDYVREARERAGLATLPLPPV